LCQNNQAVLSIITVTGLSVSGLVSVYCAYTGLAESNGSLPTGGWLTVTCGLTACTPGSAPGPTLGIQYGKPLPFFSKKKIYWSTLALCCCVDACMRWRWSDVGVTVLAVTRWSHRRQSDGDCQRRTGIPADGQALSWTWNTNRFLDWLIDWVKVFVSHLTQMAQNRLWHSTEETKPNTTKANSTRTK